MKPLFFRILVLLLGAFATVAILSFLVFKWVSEELHPDEGQLRSLVEETSERVVVAYQEDTLESLRRRLHHRYRTRLWILDSNNASLTSPPIPPEIFTQIGSFPSVIYPFENSAGRFFIFTHAVSRGDNQYRVVLAAKGPPPGSGFFRGSFVIPVSLILTLLIASAMLSYWILRPLRVLSRVTKSVSGDSLDIKVPNSLTTRKDAFGDLGTEFNRMTDRVRQAVENQQQLLRDVSHELRSPLARIQVAASLWQQKHGELTEVQRIEEEVDRLNHLIEKLLSLSRLQNQQTTALDKINVNELISVVIEDCNFEYLERDCRAVLESNKPAWLVGDEELLSSCFENILRNALRHSPNPGVVTVSIIDKEEWVQIDFIDQGAGVAKQNLDRIFEPFFRGDSARGIDAGHHGIGLAIAQTVIRLHGGTITASNNDSSGLTVRCLLPSEASVPRSALPTNKLT